MRQSSVIMTRILHGSFLPGPQRFVCWGEQEQTAPRKKGRQPKRVRHPFAMSSQQMAEWASGLVSGLEVTPTVQTIWLPSTPEGSARRPQPSPEFLATGAVERSADVALSLRAWQIDAISLPTMDAVDLLLTISGNAVAQAGSDLLFWRSAALYALSLVTAQEVLPCLERIGFQLRAFWKADPRQPDQFIALVKLMPPVCRAMEADPDAAATSASLLEAFVNAVTDNTIRQAAQSAQWRPPATPGGKWLAALTGDDPLVTIKGADADRLYKDWQTWTGQAGVAGNAAFKIALRLETPDDYHANWRITYLLQATDDPSLIIPAGQVWRGDSADYLRQRFDQPQERLLTGLGFAARLFPPINGSLRNVAPEYAGLDVNQAYVFLREVAPLLQQSGFHVLLPRWWSGRSAAVSVKAKLKGSKVTGKSLLTLDTLVNYEWQVKLGGQPISREEFEALAALKQPLVMLRGQWVALDEGQVTQALKFFDERSGQTTLEEALRLGLGGEDGATTDGIRVEGTDATGWLKALLKSLRQPDQIEPVPIPAGLHVRCGLTRSAVMPGWSFCAATGWARAWPTTWAWARRPRPSRCCFTPATRRK
jgi:hypothetical protein